MLKKSPAISLFVLSLVTAAPAAMAASPCKGLSQNACSANKACAWVAGYTRKDGAKVKDYCRSSGQSQTKAKAKEATGNSKG